MTRIYKKFVWYCFADKLNWMDVSDIQKMFDKIAEDVYRDIEETADKDFTSEDVFIAIRRVLFKKLGIAE